MGALGCSEGPLPSSVVCACTLAVKTPATARIKIVKLAMNLSFMAYLFRTGPCTSSAKLRLVPHIAKQLSCQNAPEINRCNPFVFSKEGGVFSRKIGEKIEAGGRSKPSGGFQPTEGSARWQTRHRWLSIRSAKNTQAPIANRSISRFQLETYPLSGIRSLTFLLPLIRNPNLRQPVA